MAGEKKPGAATGAGVIEVVFSAIGVIILLAAIFGLIAAASLMSQFGDMVDESISEAMTASGVTADVGAFATIAIIVSVIGLGVCVVGLIGGIMILAGKKAGMGLSMVWVIVSFIIFLASTIVSVAQGTFTALNFIGGLIWQVTPALIVLILLQNKAVKDFYAKAA